jgi:uncharacterized membrane protein YcaP (DUF421 family)
MLGNKNAIANIVSAILENDGGLGAVAIPHSPPKPDSPVMSVQQPLHLFIQMNTLELDLGHADSEQLFGRAYEKVQKLRERLTFEDSFPRQLRGSSHTSIPSPYPSRSCAKWAPIKC